MWMEIYGQFEQYFEALSSLMEKSVAFPENMSEYDNNLANQADSPTDSNTGGMPPMPKPHIDRGFPTPKPVPLPEKTPQPSASSGSYSEQIVALESLRGLLTDMLQNNDTFEDCNQRK